MSRKRVAVREPFCPVGCQHPFSGAIHRVGAGGCTECIKFMAQGVQQQGEISARLIALEDEALRIRSANAIPSPQSPNKQVNALVASAQSFMTDIQHQQMSGYGQTKKSAQVSGGSGAAVAAASATTTAAASLTKVCTVGIHIEVANSPLGGRGGFATSILKKDQHITRYDGHRLDTATFERKLTCSRMDHCISKLPEEIRKAILKVRYNKTWAVTVGRSLIARICIDGTISASPLLDSLSDRGGFGIGSVLNSSDNTGVKPNCILLFIKRDNKFLLSNAGFFVPEEHEKYDGIIVALRQIEIGVEIFLCISS